jgi:hypothetical protein
MFTKQHWNKFCLKVTLHAHDTFAEALLSEHCSYFLIKVSSTETCSFTKNAHARTHARASEHTHTQQITQCAPATRGQTSEHIIYVCKILESQGSSLIHHITARGGDWPPHQRRTGSQLFKCILKIHQIYRLSKTELDNPCTRPERNSSSCGINSDIFKTILL